MKSNEFLLQYFDRKMIKENDNLADLYDFLSEKFGTETGGEIFKAIWSEFASTRLNFPAVASCGELIEEAILQNGKVPYGKLRRSLGLSDERFRKFIKKTKQKKARISDEQLFRSDESLRK